MKSFLLTPLREGRRSVWWRSDWSWTYFYSRPCGRGDTKQGEDVTHCMCNFYSRPCGRGDVQLYAINRFRYDFYSRPCGRGDLSSEAILAMPHISTHAPAGGATGGDRQNAERGGDFYSRPCGRGDTRCFWAVSRKWSLFLLTPLREGRRVVTRSCRSRSCISTHAPAGGATG